MVPCQSSKLRASCYSREAINLFLFELVLSTVYKTRFERYIEAPDRSIWYTHTHTHRHDGRGSIYAVPPVNREEARCVGWLQGAARCLLYKSWPGPAPQEKTEGRKPGWGGEERLISFLKLGYDLSGFRLSTCAFLHGPTPSLNRLSDSNRGGG